MRWSGQRVGHYFHLPDGQFIKSAWHFTPTILIFRVIRLILSILEIRMFTSESGNGFTCGNIKFSHSEWLNSIGSPSFGRK